MPEVITKRAVYKTTHCSILLLDWYEAPIVISFFWKFRIGQTVEEE